MGRTPTSRAAGQHYHTIQEDIYGIPDQVTEKSVGAINISASGSHYHNVNAVGRPKIATPKIVANRHAPFVCLALIAALAFIAALLLRGLV